METGISTLVTRDGFLIYVPDQCDFNSIFADPQNSIIEITQYPNRTGIFIELYVQYMFEIVRNYSPNLARNYKH